MAGRTDHGIRRKLPDDQSGDVAPEALAAGFTHREPGAEGTGFAAGGAADRLVPGPVLAEFTARAWTGGLGALTDDEVVGVLCGWRRLASWAMAGELAAVSVLAGRRPAPGLKDDGHLDAEIAAALTLTGRAASRVTGLAAGLARLLDDAAGRVAGPDRRARRSRGPGARWTPGPAVIWPGCSPGSQVLAGA